MRVRRVAVGLLLTLPGLATAASPVEAQVFRPGGGISSPRLIHKVPPTYPVEALQAGIQGAVELEAVVRGDGTVGPVRVVRSLGARYGLDERAIEAARQWTFEPARLQGRPVDVAVRFVVEFKSYGSATGGAGAFAPDVAWEGDPGVFPPIVVNAVEPKYPPLAMLEEVEGEVELEVVVQRDGRVGDVRVTRLLSPLTGIDAAAIAAARQWRFEPGTVAGVPAPVVVTITLEFRLR